MAKPKDSEADNILDMSSIEQLLSQWSGDAVVARFDRPTSSWIFIALHDTGFGPATGGTRMKSYDQPADALLDAQRLGEGMTFKWRALGMEKGGGKAVIAVPPDLDPQERQPLLLRYARLLEHLGGAFATGPDLGTTAEDMALISGETQWVHGLLTDGTAIDPGPYTARGVLIGIEAAVERVFGSSLEGRSVLVEGLGGVGRPLARELRQRGARLLLSDIDADAVGALAAELEAQVVAPDASRTTACDVYAPCAIGGRLDPESIATLGCRIVGGSANNQLRDREDAELLHQRGVLYCPDYVINGGGALIFGLMGSREKEMPSMEPLARVGDRLREIFEEAERSGLSTVSVIERMIAQG